MTGPDDDPSPKRTPRLSHAGLPGLVLLGIGLVVTLVGHQLISRSVQEAEHARFNAEAMTQVQAVRELLTRNLDAVKSLGSFFDASEFVSRREFASFASQEISRVKEIQALSWNPILPRRRLEDIRRLAESEGMRGFSFYELGSDGARAPLGDRKNYVPVLYIEPYEANKAAVGFDVGSNASRRAAFEKAMETGEAVASGVIRLVQGSSSAPAALVFRPVYINGTIPDAVEKRRQSIKGFAVGVVRLDRVVIRALEATSVGGMFLEIHDRTGGNETESLLYRYPKDAQLADGHMAHTAPLAFAGRDWRITIHNDANYSGVVAKYASTGYVAALLLVTFLAFGYLVSARARETTIAQQVEARSEELAREVARSKSMQDALSASETRYRALFNGVPIGILVSEGELVDEANAVAAQILGESDPAGIIGRPALDIIEPAERHIAKQRLAALDSRETVDPFEVTFVRSDGSRFRALAAITSVVIENRPVIIRTFRDISVEFAAREALREGEEKYRSLIDLFPDSVILTSQSIITEINAAGVRLHGAKDESELIGRDWIELVDETYHDKVYERRALMARGEMADATEFLMKRVDGSTFWAEGRAIQVTVGGEKMFMTVSRDITREREAAKILEQSEARYRYLFETAPDAFFVIQNDRIVFANDRCASMYGVNSPGDLVGADPLRFVDPDYTDHLARLRNELLEGGGAGDYYEMVHLTASGKRIETEDASIKIDWAGAPAVLCVLRDISIRKEAERALSRSEENYRQLTELSPEAITVQGLDTVMFGNEAAATLYGYESAEDIAGQNILSLFSEAQQKRFRKIRERILTGSEPVTGGTETFVNARNERKSIISSIAPMEWNGEPACLVINQDVTTIREAQERLEEANKELARSNEDLAQFAYVASHDLKEPLRMVSSYCQLIADRYSEQLDDRGKEFVHYAVDGAVRMRTLIDDLLVYSRIGREGLEQSDIDLNAVVQGVLETLAPAVKDAAANIAFSNLPTVKGYRSEMNRLFQNLIGNAIKFRSDLPLRVDISATTRDGKATIRVADNGIGIPEQYLEQVFGVFKRLHNRSQYEGTGIGLAICEKIVEQLGGDIRAEPGEDGGTTFIVTLPLGGKPSISATLERVKGIEPSS